LGAARQRMASLLDLFSRVNKKSVAVFLDQLALMIENGLSPGVAIDSLAEQQDDPRFGKILDDICNKVHTGSDLSAAFGLYPDLFPPTTLVLVRAGEEGGDIAGRLRRASTLLQRQLDFQSRVKHAVTSPLITAGACGLVLFLVVKLVFPRFVALYQQMDLEFPAISRVVFTFVEFLNHPITMLLIVAGIVASIMFRKELTQKLLNFLLWFPWTQPVVGKILCASLCETLAYLHRDGVPVHRALHMITVTTPFEVHRNKLENAKRILTVTGSLSEALESMVYFPRVFHSMLAVGEESGSMDELLSANQKLMEEEIDHLVGQITAMLEPLVICGMGICMAILFIGMFLPIYGILSKLGG
jgi:type IV pilus assembly protein PilC